MDTGKELRDFCPDNGLYLKIRRALWIAHDKRNSVPKDWIPTVEHYLSSRDQKIPNVGEKGRAILEAWGGQK